MKKVLTLAAIMIAAISANAQHVNPINFELTKFQLDSLRAKYVNDPANLLIQLQGIDDAQKRDANTLKDLQKELKQEKQYAKNLATYAKAAAGNYKQLQKNEESNQKSIKKMRDVASDQQAVIRKLDLVKDKQKEEFIKSLGEQSTRYSNQISESQNELSFIKKQMGEIETLQNQLKTLDQEIKTKEGQLKNLEAAQKENSKQIATEIKIAKDMVKAQK
ncbi:MAG: hypothetical protein J6T32_01305 [Paludibacteraceae bacterium]|nr:hypothetical protein [Paludibacteraceae bacterium]